VGGGGRRHSEEERVRVVRLVEEAVGRGARREAAAQTLGLSPRTLERWRREGTVGEDRRRGPKSAPPNQLSEAERTRVLELVNSPAYRDLSPKQIVPRLLDEKGLYLVSESTIYRLLHAEGQMTHRERSRPATSKRPREQVATGPNQVWSWDITWLPGPVRGTFFYLYLILDVWSRKIVGARVHAEENSRLAAELFAETCRRLGLDPEGLVLHSDNGSPMKGSTMLATLQWLGVRASFGRPGVSNDNPFSESLFRTMKYRPHYPSRPFASLEEAQTWVTRFIAWYNREHRHSAIRYVTPDERHHGQEVAILERRQRIYERARAAHSERWSGKTRDWTPVATVRLNPDPTTAEMKRAA
jgi:putative transposase